MNSRVLIGGAVVLALAAGGFLAGRLPNRKPDPVSQSGNVDPADSVDPFLSDIQTADSGEMEPSQTPDSVADDEQVLNVRVTDQDYFIARSHGRSREYRAATLEEVVSAAQDRAGDERGVRVRVVRKKSSKSPGELHLQDALISAGIDPDAIDWGSGTRR